MRFSALSAEPCLVIHIQISARSANKQKNEQKFSSNFGDHRPIFPTTDQNLTMKNVHEFVKTRRILMRFVALSLKSCLIIHIQISFDSRNGVKNENLFSMKFSTTDQIHYHRPSHKFIKTRQISMRFFAISVESCLVKGCQISARLVNGEKNEQTFSSNFDDHRPIFRPQTKISQRKMAVNSSNLDRF